MSYDKTQPTDTTKIRNLGTVIRPNWVAIEEGDSSFKPYALNLQDRTPLAESNDPTNISGSSIVYVKQDGAGNPELYAEDEDANIIQLTEAGRLGGPSTDLKLNEFRFGSSTTDYGRNNIIGAYVRWNSSGTALSSFGCSISKVATGVYEITLSEARNNTNYVPVATPQNEGNVRLVKISIQSTTKFRVRIENSDQNGRDTGGYCHVVGGF